MVLQQSTQPKRRRSWTSHCCEGNLSFPQMSSHRSRSRHTRWEFKWYKCWIRFCECKCATGSFCCCLTWQFYSERTSSWPRLRKLREVRTRARWLRGLQEETRWHLFLVSNCQWQVHNWSFCDKHSFHLAWGRGLPRALSVTMASWWFCNWEEEERKKMHLQVVD